MMKDNYNTGNTLEEQNEFSKKMTELYGKYHWGLMGKPWIIFDDMFSDFFMTPNKNMK